ncbi:MAG: TraB/GumN family protein, partial [Bacteroidota bacterium]
MNRLLSFLPLLIVALLTACSPKTTSAVTNTANPTITAPAASPKFAPSANDTSLLWRISGPGVTNESYLFGTIHIIPADDYFLPNGLVSSLNDADEVIFEIDPRDMSDPSMLMSLMTRINMRGDTSLEDLLTEEEYATVESYFSKTGLPFFLLKRMKPLFLSAMVGQDMSLLQGGGDLSASSSKSYEFELTAMAEKADKAIGGLETMEFQLGLFDSIPYGAQAKMLHKAVLADSDGDQADGENEMEKVVKLYKRKAIAEMAESFSDEETGVARFEELLLTK